MFLLLYLNNYFIFIINAEYINKINYSNFSLYIYICMSLYKTCTTKEILQKRIKENIGNTWNVTWITEWDKENISAIEKDKFNPKNTLSQAMLSLDMKHNEALLKIKKENIEYGLILEDDVKMLQK